MDRPTPEGIEILLKGLLKVDQGTLARAVAIVLQGRDHDGIVCVFISHEFTLFLNYRTTASIKNRRALQA
jgi:hypothetical protein